MDDVQNVIKKFREFGNKSCFLNYFLFLNKENKNKINPKIRTAAATRFIQRFSFIAPITESNK